MLRSCLLCLLCVVVMSGCTSQHTPIRAKSQRSSANTKQAPPSAHKRHTPKSPKGTASFQLSVASLPCAGCRQGLLQMVRRYQGVHKVHIAHGERLCVHFDPRRTTENQLVQHMTSSQIKCIAKTKRKSLPRQILWPKGLDMRIISKKGERVSLRANLARGKITIFDFTADWCVPCRTLDQMLIKMMQKRSDFAVRKIKIDTFREPVARQHIPGIYGVPLMMFYNRKGKRVAIVRGFSPDEIQAALRKANQ